MKISNKLPKYEESTLLVVSSQTGSIFYLVKGDTLEKVAEFKVEKPKYSDSEDFQVGAQVDRNKSVVYRDFKIKFSETAKKLSKTLNIKKLYLFTTKNTSHALEALLPGSWKKCLAAHKRGDFTKAHPFTILRKASV